MSRVAAALSLVALACVACPEARADRGPPGPYSATASPSASVSAPPLERQPAIEAGRKPWVPTPPQLPFPETKSDRPTKKEWITAPMANEVRRTQTDCKVQRIREWYRVGCEGHVAVSLVSGGRAGVDAGAIHLGDPDVSPSEVWVVFPARRGDARVFQLFRWSKWAPGEADAIVSQQYLDGDPHPLITVQGIRWGF